MTATKYNLIIIHSSGQQHVSDFLTARNMMAGRAPDIAVHVLSREVAVPPDFWRDAARLPTLIFAPEPYDPPAAARGARLVGVHLSKLKEVELLAKAGLPVPMTKAVTPDLVLDEARWGPFTVIKPNEGGGGEGIRLVRTRDVRWVDPLSWPKDDPRHGRLLIAQQFVDTGEFLKCFRVMTILGQPIYANESTTLAPRPPLDARGAGPIDLPVAANDLPRRILSTYDEEIIAFAREIHARLEHVPNMGIDIVRQADSGALFVLEVNSSGRTWHLSSSFGLGQQRRNGHDYYGQFNALDTIVKAFIATTRRLAE